MHIAQSQPYGKAFQKLLRASPNDLAGRDIAEMNLLCAYGLPGAEEMDIPKCLETIDAWTRTIAWETARLLPKFRANPAYFECSPDTSVAWFCASLMVTILKRDIGIHFKPKLMQNAADVDPQDLNWKDSKDLFIHGLLSSNRSGTCNSIPVLVVAIGRRLGYPLKLAATQNHVWARWESADGRERFNIEASNPAGMTSQDDADYAKDLKKLIPIPTDYYLKSFTSADELALFLMSQGWVLEDNQRNREALPSLAKCCFLAPEEPMYPRQAHRILANALYLVKHGNHFPNSFGTPRRMQSDINVEGDSLEFLSRTEAAMALSIEGHLHEVCGRVREALLAYKNVCKINSQNCDYATDLKRYVQKAAKPVVVPTVTFSPDDRQKENAPLPQIVSPVLINASEHPIVSARKAQCAAFETKGLHLEQDGKLVEAQVAFMQGWSPSEDNVTCRVSLHRVIRKEVLAGTAPSPHLQQPSAGENHGNDPRLLLFPDQQAAIWAERGVVLEVMARLQDALKCYDQARLLNPRHPQYGQNIQRVEMKLNQLRATSHKNSSQTKALNARKDGTRVSSRNFVVTLDTSTGFVVGPVSAPQSIRIVNIRGNSKEKNDV